MSQREAIEFATAHCNGVLSCASSSTKHGQHAVGGDCSAISSMSVKSIRLFVDFHATYLCQSRSSRSPTHQLASSEGAAYSLRPCSNGIIRFRHFDQNPMICAPSVWPSVSEVFHSSGSPGRPPS